MIININIAWYTDFFGCFCLYMLICDFNAFSRNIRGSRRRLRSSKWGNQKCWLDEDESFVFRRSVDDEERNVRQEPCCARVSSVVDSVERGKRSRGVVLAMCRRVTTTHCHFFPLPVVVIVASILLVSTLRLLITSFAERRPVACDP